MHFLRINLNQVLFRALSAAQLVPTRQLGHPFEVYLILGKSLAHPQPRRALERRPPSGACWIWTHLPHQPQRAETCPALSLHQSCLHSKSEAPVSLRTTENDPMRRINPSNSARELRWGAMNLQQATNFRECMGQTSFLSRSSRRISFFRYVRAIELNLSKKKK